MQLLHAAIILYLFGLLTLRTFDEDTQFRETLKTDGQATIVSVATTGSSWFSQ